MKKLSIKTIIEFKKKSDKSKKYFASTLMNDKPKRVKDGGGDYWASSLSALSNSFKFDTLKYIFEKEDELVKKSAEDRPEITKKMYRQNIAILNKYEDFDLRKWKPTKKLLLLVKHREDFILTIRGFQVQIAPQHVFAFQKNDTKEVGAIWFVAQLDGFKNDELGMFTEILYRYLKSHYSKNYNINPRYCIAVDVFNKHEVSYSQLEKGEIPLILNLTLDEIKKLL